MSFRSWMGLSLALALAAGSAPAEAQVSAQNAAAAQALFEEGLKLSKEGKLEEACPKFAASDKLDPGVGTKFQLGQCYEKTGRLASAWSVFKEGADAAERDNDTQRMEYLRKRASALESKLPRLKILVPPESAADGLAVKRDGQAVDATLWGTEIPVDPGTHALEAEAPGKKGWREEVELKEGQPLEVTIPRLADLPDEEKGGGAGDVAPSGPRTGLWIAGIAGGVAAVAGFAIDGIFWAKASSDWDEAKSLCDNPEQLTGCRAPADELSKSARSAGVISAVGFGIGIAGLATAATAGIIALTSKPGTGGEQTSRIQVLPAVGPNLAAAAVRVQF